MGDDGARRGFDDENEGGRRELPARNTWEPTIVRDRDSEGLERAELAIQMGSFAALFACALSVYQLAEAYLIDPKFALTPENWARPLALVALTIGVASKNRPATSVLLALTLADAALTLRVGTADGVDPVALAWMGFQLTLSCFYVYALTGMHAYHQIRARQSDRGHKGHERLSRATSWLIGSFSLALIVAVYFYNTDRRPTFGAPGKAPFSMKQKSGGSGKSGGGGGAPAASSSGGSSGAGGSGGSGASGGGPGGGGAPSPAMSRSAGQDGEEYARDTDEDGCVGEAVRRHAVCRDADCKVLSGVFLGACLANTATTPGFCRPVPPVESRAASAAWRSRMCEGSLAAGEYCETIFEAVQIHCYTAGRTAQEP